MRRRPLRLDLGRNRSEPQVVGGYTCFLPKPIPLSTETATGSSCSLEFTSRFLPLKIVEVTQIDAFHFGANRINIAQHARINYRKRSHAILKKEDNIFTSRFEKLIFGYIISSVVRNINAIGGIVA